MIRDNLFNGISTHGCCFWALYCLHWLFNEQKQEIKNQPLLALSEAPATKLK